MPSLRRLSLLLLLLGLMATSSLARVGEEAGAGDDDEEEARVEQEDGEEEVISVETLKSEDNVIYITPETNPDVFFAEHFDDEEAFEKKWIKCVENQSQIFLDTMWEVLKKGV